MKLSLPVAEVDLHPVLQATEGEGGVQFANSCLETLWKRHLVDFLSIDCEEYILGHESVAYAQCGAFLP